MWNVMVGRTARKISSIPAEDIAKMRADDVGAGQSLPATNRGRRLQ
jgi:hypothetical protein